MSEIPKTYSGPGLVDIQINGYAGFDFNGPAADWTADVLHAITCCVTREGFEVHEAIGVDDAVRMFTLDAAYAQFEEREKGSISPGKRADLVVLSESPWAVAPDEIRRIRVEQTLIAGRVVYERG